MTELERKVWRRMIRKAFLRGILFQPSPSVDELLKEFHKRVKKEMEKTKC